uniref:Superoxide dismutase copper/zinc binding domain-containing protein n=1 Tax=Cyprinus carpio TaxID=7962 RepID=A0A8C2K8N6_CYPCA
RWKKILYIFFYLHMFTLTCASLAYASNPVSPPVISDYLRIVTLRLNGLPVQPGAMYIHEYGDLSKGCGSTGGHCNLLSVNHPQHPGDFGNFIPVNENIHQSLDSSATLFGRLLKKMDDQVVQAGVDEDQGKR